MNKLRPRRYHMDTNGVEARFPDGFFVGADEVAVSYTHLGGVLTGLFADDLDELHNVGLQGVAVVPPVSYTHLHEHTND